MKSPSAPSKNANQPEGYWHLIIKDQGSTRSHIRKNDLKPNGFVKLSGFGRRMMRKASFPVDARHKLCQRVRQYPDEVKMAKAEWGVKRACPKCDERFYDLNKDPAECPNCGNVFEIASLYQSDIRSPASSEKQSKASDEFDQADVIDEDDDIAVDDELLEEDDDSTVSIEEIADVPTESDDN